MKLAEQARVKKEGNEVLTQLAAALATIAISRDNREVCAVTFKFIAERDPKGVNISDISLEWKK